MGDDRFILPGVQKSIRKARHTLGMSVQSHECTQVTYTHRLQVTEGMSCCLNTLHLKKVFIHQMCKKKIHVVHDFT